jgi:hypothetical protein
VPDSNGLSGAKRPARFAARAAAPRGFGLNPRLVAAFCDHPAWTHADLRSADFKGMRVAANDPALAVPPPPPAPWPIPGGAISRAPFARNFQ